MTFDFDSSVDLLNITFSTKFTLKTKKNIKKNKNNNIKKRKNVSFLDEKSYHAMLDNNIENIIPNIIPNIIHNVDNNQLEERSLKRPRSNAIIS
jgi:hypothetical protein